MDNKNIVLAISAGLLFGFWPLVMQRSGLGHFWQGTIFSLFVMLVMLAPALYQGWDSQVQVSWTAIFCAGLAGGFGLLLFTKMISESTPQELGALFCIVLVVQAVVAAIYHSVMNGELSLKKSVGFVLAGLALYLIK